jgi:hypothetical protein
VVGDRFASGVSPNSAARSGPGTVGLPVDISGAVRAAESSYPRGPGGEVRVPEFVRTLLESGQVRYLD